MGLRLHRPGRRFYLLISIVVVISVVGVLLYNRFSDKTEKVKEPETAQEAVKDMAVVSSPTPEFTDALKDFSGKTKNVGEQYQAYLKLCYAYNNLNDYKSAQEYCGKALAIADAASVSADDKKTLEGLIQFINSKAAYNKAPENPTGYTEPTE